MPLEGWRERDGECKLDGTWRLLFTTGADATFRAFGSGGGLERYWRLAVEGLNERFRAAEVLGDDRLRATALRRVRCAGLRRVRWVDPAGPFYDDTPGSGHPVAYETPGPRDPLLVACLNKNV